MMLSFGNTARRSSAISRLVSTSSKDLPIIIVGGGIGGLSTAIALARANYNVKVFEQAHEFKEVGAGLQFGPNIFRMLEHLGLKQQTLDISFFPEKIQLMDGISGEEIFHVSQKHFQAAYGNPYVAFYRPDFLNVLLEGCKQYPNIELFNRCKLSGIKQDFRQVQAEFADGSTISGQALIGADGINSTVRSTLFGAEEPKPSGHIAFRAMIPLHKVPKHLWEPNVTLWAGPNLHLVHYPMKHDEIFNVAAIIDNGGVLINGNEAMTLLKTRYAAAHPRLMELLDLVETHKVWPVRDKEPIKNWTVDRVTLLGDAAHPMYQYTAQGAGMAIEDAVVLAEALRHSEGNISDALKLYNDARYLRTARVQTTARLFGMVYHVGDVKRELRNALFKEFESETANPGFLSLAWLYKGLDIKQLF